MPLSGLRNPRYCVQDLVIMPGWGADFMGLQENMSGEKTSSSHSTQGKFDKLLICNSYVEDSLGKNPVFLFFIVSQSGEQW
jgi:hypothetical protein